MRINRFVCLIASAAVLLLSATAGASETITFDDDGLGHGDTVASVFSDGGHGPISIFGESGKDLGGANWARAFDSNTPTCGDEDLGTPNETCDPPGVGVGPGIGADGEMGQPNENCVALDNVLIIQELDCATGTCTPTCTPSSGEDPFADDSDNLGGTILFDFSALPNPVTIHSIDFLDVEADEPNAVLDLLDGSMVPITTANGSPVGDNGFGTIDVGSVSGVVYAILDLNGSGAIDNLVFDFCGDGDVDEGETCDDGNDIDDDECRNDCTQPFCGDGILDAGEECDDGNNVDGDGCQANCMNPFCGDGILDAGEECDDGNNVDGDGCQANCMNPFCGDGILDAGEECDDGNNVDGDGCQANCMNPFCGDGILDAGEECDDGNNVDGDGCQANCMNPFCGDGILDAGEECDDGNNVDGDGCQANCMNPFCGDGILDAGEECDDGNNVDGDGCQANCMNPECGDGIVDPGEECDDGNQVNDDECSNDCTTPQPIACRMTGGGNDRGNASEENRFTYGGQAGAPTAEQPQPYGEWTHHQRRGPGGRWVFHAGTASAPPGTEIDSITCSDPGWCNPARHAPAKQLDFDGVGTFRNFGFGPPEMDGVIAKDTYHWFEVHIEDLGEPGSEMGDENSDVCPAIGNDGEVASCSCLDFYRIVIYKEFDPDSDLPNKSDVIYFQEGYVDGGNLQIHPPVGGPQF